MIPEGFLPERRWDGWVLDPSAERLEGPGVLDMAYPIVQDRLPPEPVVEALREAAALVHRYPHREREVREALARYLAVHPSQVLPTVGANGALDLASRVFLARRRVVVPVPAFWQLVEAPQRYGAEVTCPDLLAPNACELIVAAFDQADAVILCSPHNPLGQPAAPDLLSRLLEISRGRPVLVDESYADLEGLTAAREGMHPDLVLIRGFKTFLIPGVRVGYLVASEERIRGLAHARPPFEGNVFSEAAILAVLKEIAALRTIWSEVRSDLRYLEAGLAALGGEVQPSSTLFACWRHPRAREIARILATAGIFVISTDRPVIRGMPPDLLRITARRRDLEDQALAAIAAILERLAELSPTPSEV